MGWTKQTMIRSVLHVFQYLLYFVFKPFHYQTVAGGILSIPHPSTVPSDLCPVVDYVQDILVVTPGLVPACDLAAAAGLKSHFHQAMESATAQTRKQAIYRWLNAKTTLLTHWSYVSFALSHRHFTAPRRHGSSTFLLRPPPKRGHKFKVVPHEGWNKSNFV